MIFFEKFFTDFDVEFSLTIRYKIKIEVSQRGKISS